MKGAQNLALSLDGIWVDYRSITEILDTDWLETKPQKMVRFGGQLTHRLDLARSERNLDTGLVKASEASESKLKEILYYTKISGEL